jgi:nucleoid DNA-binding protein
MSSIGASNRRPRRLTSADVVHDDTLSVLVFGQVREDLLRGEAVVLPGLGRFEVQRREAYDITHPDSGRTTRIEAERKVVYQPERSLLRTLNAEPAGSSLESKP